jgi:O-antigen ligase
MRPRQSSKVRRPATVRWQAYAVAALVFVAILFGGGGGEGPLNNGIIQSLAAILLSLLFASHVRGSWPLPKVAAGATWLLLSLLLIVLVQLMPLPPDLWRSLPGRELAEAALALTGSTGEWRPLSLEPEATRRAAAALLLPAAILYGIVGATRREILLIVLSAIVAAGVSGLIGALQLILGTPGWLSYYEGPNPGSASGVFANPNHHALLLIAAMLLLAFRIRADRSGDEQRRDRGVSASFHPGWLALPFFVVLTLATSSRAGMILLLVAAPGALLIALGRRSPLLWLGGLAGVALLVGLTIVFSPSGNALAVGESFIFSDDGRYSFLPDVVFTLRQYWPWGSGLGTFVPVFAPNENLDVAGSGYVNHAHNDWLEWLLEMGIVGAVWLVAAIAILLWRLGSVTRMRAQLRGTQFAAIVVGGLILLLLGLHSLIDYPGRAEAVTVVAAIAAGLIFAPLTDAPPRPLTEGGPIWPMVAGGVAGLVLALLVVRLFAAQAAVRNDNGSLALTLRPNSGDALALVAQQQLRMKNLPAARRLATAAIERAPLNSAAVRVLAMTHEPAAAMEPWRIASAMGWRDGPTQLWALQQALTNGEFEVAAVRADAFLRTRTRPPREYLAIVRTAALEPSFRAALVERLKLDPTWRGSFLNLLTEVSNQELVGTYELLRTLAATGGEPTLGEARATIGRLLERGRYDEAVALYHAVRGPRPSSAELLDDGGFDRPAEEYFANTTPFDWLLRRASGGTATVEEQNGQVLFLETDGAAARTLLSRYVPVDQGTYRLRYVRGGDPESPEALAISIRCAGGQPIATSSSEPLQGSKLQRREIQFGIGPNCPMIVIGFEARPVGRPAASEFDDFSLRRVSR